MPGLAGDASKIARIEISQGPDKLTLEREGDKWLIASREGYPASTERVRALVAGSTDAQLIEAKTRNVERLKVLALEEPDTKNANSRLIRFMDGNGAMLGEVIAGKSRADAPGASSSGTYVRKPGDPQAWLASTSLEGGTSLADWAEKHLYEAQTEKIAELVVTVAGEQPYTVKRTSDDQFVVADMPAGKKLKFVNITDLMVEAASFFDLEDVRKASGELKGDARGQVEVKTDAGLTIRLAISTDKDATWARIEATGTGDGAKAASEIAARTRGWEFKMLPSKAATLLKKRDELLEDAPS